MRPRSTLSLLRPRTLADALRDAARRGAADAARRMHRRLRQPAVRHARATRGSSICGRSTSCAASARPRRAAHRRADDVHRDRSSRRSCGGGCRCWSRRRARSAAARSRIAARSAATSPTRRRPATRCRCWPRPMRRRAASADGERRVPFTAFYTGYRASVRRPDELIAAIEIPRIDGAQYWRKVGTRRAQAISKVMCAAVRGPSVRSRSAASRRPSSACRGPKPCSQAAVRSRQHRQTLRAGDRADRRLRSTADYRRDGRRQPARRLLAAQDAAAMRVPCARPSPSLLRHAHRRSVVA